MLSLAIRLRASNRMILNSPCKQRGFRSTYRSLVGLKLSHGHLEPKLTSPAKLGFGDVCGGWTTAGVGASLTVSSITAGVISFISRSAVEISEDARVSTGGVSTAADLKAQGFVLMEQRKKAKSGHFWINLTCALCPPPVFAEQGRDARQMLP